MFQLQENVVELVNIGMAEELLWEMEGIKKFSYLLQLKEVNVISCL